MRAETRVRCRAISRAGRVPLFKCGSSPAMVAVLALGLLVPTLAYSRPAAAEAASEFSEAVDLPRLRASALASNPEIKAAEERWRAAQARPSQEGTLPDPMINTAYHNESFERLRQGRTDFAFLRFGIEQELPFPGKLTLKQQAAAQEADREGALYRATTLDVVTRLRLAYADYALAHQSLEILGKNKTLLTQLAEGAKARYRVGDGLQQDVLRADVELSILLGRLTSLEQMRESAAANLNAVLNRPSRAPLGAPTSIEKTPLGHTLEEFESIARESSPSLAAAELGVEKAETSLTLARRQFYPDFVLRADYFNKAARVPEWEVGAGVRVPLYFWRKQAFGVREAAAGTSEARASQQSARQDVLAKVKDFHAQASAADRLVTLYATAVVPQAEASLNSALAGYQTGAVDFLTLLSSFTVLNEYQLRYYEELANFEKARAQLEAAAGILPDVDREPGSPAR